DRALDRCREESAHRLGARAGIDGGDDDRGALDLRVLLDRQRAGGSPADEHDHQVDHHREDGAFDEDIRDGAHGQRALEARADWLTIATSAASRSLKDPDAATRSPGDRPASTRTSLPAAGPVLTVRACARVEPSGPDSITNTWSPAGPRRSALAGMATASLDGPCATRTRTEAPGARRTCGESTRARTVAFRVAGSIRASKATIRAGTGCAYGDRSSSTRSPELSSAATCWATSKSTCAAVSTPWIVVRTVPASRNCPGWTSASPTRARNGARIVLRSMMAS